MFANEKDCRQYPYAEPQEVNSTLDKVTLYGGCGFYGVAVETLLADVNAQLAAQQQEINDLKQLISELP